MFVLPIQTPGHTNDRLIIILHQKENLDAMAQADPTTIGPDSYGPNMVLVNPSIMICHEEENPVLLALLSARPRNKATVDAIIKHLMRGFEFIPERGDGKAAYDPFPEKPAGPG